MTEVNRRPYDSRARRAASAALRHAVLERAHDLLIAEGFHRTTVTKVAAAADVSPEWIYKTFRSKAGLAKSVHDFVIAGDDAPRTVAQRENAEEIRREPDARRKIAIYAQDATERQQRSAAIQLAIRDARREPGIADLWRTILTERLTGMELLARHLVAGGQVREDLSTAKVRDLLWTYSSIEVYELVVIERGWSHRDYQAWLTDTLAAALLPD